MGKQSLNTHGQALVEFALGLTLAVFIAIGSASTARQAWLRTRCLYRTYEATHARLVGRANLWPEVTIQEGAMSVSGSSSCGKNHEQIEFPKLELEPTEEI